MRAEELRTCNEERVTSTEPCLVWPFELLRIKFLLLASSSVSNKKWDFLDCWSSLGYNRTRQKYDDTHWRRTHVQHACSRCLDVVPIINLVIVLNKLFLSVNSLDVVLWQFSTNHWIYQSKCKWHWNLIGTVGFKLAFSDFWFNFHDLSLQNFFKLLTTYHNKLVISLGIWSNPCRHLPLATCHLTWYVPAI